MAPLRAALPSVAGPRPTNVGSSSGFARKLDDRSNLHLRNAATALCQCSCSSREPRRRSRCREVTCFASAWCGLEPLQFALEGSAAAVVQAVDRAFAAVHAVGDLAGSQSDDVAQEDHLALLVGQGGQRLADGFGVVEVWAAAGVGVEYFL